MLINGQTPKLQQTQPMSLVTASGPVDAAATTGPPASAAPRSDAGQTDKFTAAPANPHRFPLTQPGGSFWKES